jgi:FecR protein
MKINRALRFGLIGLIAAACAVIGVRSTIAAQLKEATVTQIIKEVELLPTGAAARAAALNDNVRDGTAVRTGSDSRTELTFTDQTLARLGANTIFSFNEGTRNLDLGGGAMLLRVPKGAGGAKISTAAVTAAITGTTVIIEYHPGKSVEPQKTSGREKKRGLMFGFLERKTKAPATRGGYIKFITLEGIARVYLNNRIGESVLVPAGQMLILTPDAKHMPDPVDVDLGRLLQTSLLIIDFPPLASAQLMADEADKQKALKAQGKLIDTNLVIYGGGTLVTLKDPSPLDLIDQSIAALGLSAAAGLSEVGPLPTITTPVPYDVGAGSTIKTAPTITTGGVTSQGKLYRGVAKDGLPSDYFFGSTSAFDTASGFNASVIAPAAAFKFAGDLTISGDPVIIVPKGGAQDLAFISNGTISSEAPGGTLTFAGMNSVLFATTTNGAIHFDNLVSFSNLNLLTFYARGAASSLFLQSPIQNVGAVNLFSEGPATIFNSSDTLTTLNSTPGDGGTLTTFSNADILVEGSHIMATSGVIPTNGTPAGAGGHVSLTSLNGGITLSGSAIQVSSADAPGVVNRRSSARGGTIAIESDRADNVAIQISSSSQLLSLLDAAAPGPGGLITIKATGTMSSAFVGGQIEADRGGVDIRHTGDLGTVTLDTVNIRGDIIKVAALGNVGVLTIGNSILSADSVLKLYAPGSGGMIRFVATCTIGGKVTNIIAASSVTILNGVVVDVTGKPVDVFTNQANYSGFGGNGSTTGTFSGFGATNPQPLANAPPLGSPGGP